SMASMILEGSVCDCTRSDPTRPQHKKSPTTLLVGIFISFFSRTYFTRNTRPLPIRRSCQVPPSMRLWLYSDCTTRIPSHFLTARSTPPPPEITSPLPSASRVKPSPKSYLPLTRVLPAAACPKMVNLSFGRMENFGPNRYVNVSTRPLVRKPEPVVTALPIDL